MFEPLFVITAVSLVGGAIAVAVASVPHLLDMVNLPSRASRSRLLAVVLLLTAVLVGIGVSRVAGRSTSNARATDSSRQQSPTLELVSLVHERNAAGDLELRGEVHNPANGATLEDVTAVAMLFDGQGAYLASGRAALQARTLLHGTGATFAITIPDAAAAERYRVSFRSHDRIIPHTDRRGDREESW